MELKTYLDILMGRWRIAAVAGLAVFCLGVAGSFLIAPKYQAEVQLRVVTPLGGSSGETNYQTTFANRLMNTYAQIATSDQVRSQLKSDLGVSSLPDITVRIIPESEIINIIVESSNPSLAADTANALAHILLSYRDNAESESDTNELNVLSERGDKLQAQLAKYQQQHDGLAETYSQTTADMDVLERRIQLKEDSYRNLLDQYELTVIDEAVYTDATKRATKDALAAEIARIDEELALLNQEYKGLSTKSSQYMQQIILLRLSIQDTESAYSDLLSRYDSALLASLRQENAQNIMVISPAVLPTHPSGSSRLFTIGLGFIVGLIAGVGAAFVMNYLDPLICSSEQIERLTTAPVIGKISRFTPRTLFERLRSIPGPGRISKFYKHKAIDFPGHEDLVLQRDYLILRARLKNLLETRQIKTILLTSANRGEGKSTISKQLALGLAQDEFKTLVVDADLRLPTQKKLFAVTGDCGLSDYLSGEQRDISGLIVKEARPGIDVLPNLDECSNAVELLQSPRWNTLIGSLKNYDVVIFDTPALLAVPDALTIANTVDGVLVIAHWGRTSSHDLQTTCSSLEAIGSNVLGIVINHAPIQKESHYYYAEKRRPHREVENPSGPSA